MNTYIYNYASSNYKPCSWNQLGEKFFKNEKAVSSPDSVTNNFIPIYNIFMSFISISHRVDLYCFHSDLFSTIRNQFWMPSYHVTNNILIYWIMTFCLHIVPATIVDLYLRLLGKKPRRVLSFVQIMFNTVFICKLIIFMFEFRLIEFYKRVHAAAKHLNSYQQMRQRYHSHNVNNLMSKLSARDKILFGFDMSTLSWDDYFDRYLRGLRVYLMGNRLHRPGTNNNNTLNRYYAFD